MDEKKLVITGMGACTPIGIGVPEYWKNLIGGVCGIGKITRFDASELPVQIAASVQASSFLSFCKGAAPHGDR